MTRLYAITNNQARCHQLLQAGIDYVQYRNKDQKFDAQLGVAAKLESKLILNDDFELAQEAGVWGVHLGQEDLLKYKKSDLLNRKIALGISTHSSSEIDFALEFNPDYIAFGPIFETKTKIIEIAPQGIEKLTNIVKQVNIPVIAIGGINFDNWLAVIDTGVHAIAMISALESLSIEHIRQKLIKLK